MGRDLRTPFQPGHDERYGLEVAQRDADTGAVTQVRCRFCAAFGREFRPGLKRKQRSSIHHFKFPFRTDQYKLHMQTQHPSKWQRYQTLNSDQKRAFFGPSDAAEDLFNEVDHLATTEDPMTSMIPPRSNIVTELPKVEIPPPRSSSHLSVEQPRPSGQVSANMFLLTDTPTPKRRKADTPNGSPHCAPQSLTLDVDGAVVDALVGDILFDASDVESQPTKAKALHIFKTAKSDGAAYKVLISSARLFKLVVGFVAHGASFRSAAEMVAVTQEVTKVTYLGRCNEDLCASFVRVVCASTLSQTSRLLKTSWAYSLVLDNSDATSFVDLRVRFNSPNGKLVNLHLLALPAFESTSSDKLFETCQGVLDVLDENWRSKLVAVYTSGEQTTTDHLSDMLTLFEVAARYPLMRVWNGLQELDTIAQRAFDKFCDGHFISTLKRLSDWLRCEDLEIGSVCPKLEDVQWQTVGGVAAWIIKYRVRVVLQLETANPTCVPSSMWWVLLLCANAVATMLSTTSKRLQGFETLLGQREELVALNTRLALDCRVSGPHQPARIQALLAECCIVHGAYSVDPSDALAFIEDRGTYAIDSLEELREEEVSACLHTVGELFVSLFNGITNAVATCAARTDPLPPVVPHLLAKVRTAAVCEAIRPLRLRLLENNWTQELIESIERDHQALVQASRVEAHLEQAFRKCTDAVVNFEQGWELVGGRFQALRRFCGALATTFPNTLKQGPRSNVKVWEKDPNANSVASLSLEGVLHAKQFDAVMVLSGELRR